LSAADGIWSFAGWSESGPALSALLQVPAPACRFITAMAHSAHNVRMALTERQSAGLV
jgi:hypothetical protein